MRSRVFIFLTLFNSLWNLSGYGPVQQQYTYDIYNIQQPTKTTNQLTNKLKLKSFFQPQKNPSPIL